MRAFVAGVLICSFLVACGGALPTATLPPYTGARTHGYPTPGQFRVDRDDANGIILVVSGQQRAVVDMYLAAWRADGWTINGPNRQGNSDLANATRADKGVLLWFAPNVADPQNSVDVLLPRP